MQSILLTFFKEIVCQKNQEITFMSPTNIEYLNSKTANFEEIISWGERRYGKDVVYELTNNYCKKLSTKNQNFDFHISFDSSICNLQKTICFLTYYYSSIIENYHNVTKPFEGLLCYNKLEKVLSCFKDKIDIKNVLDYDKIRIFEIDLIENNKKYFIMNYSFGKEYHMIFDHNPYSYLSIFTIDTIVNKSLYKSSSLKELMRCLFALILNCKYKFLNKKV